MNQQKLVDLLNTLVPDEGIQEQIIEGVSLFRISEPFERTPQKYNPGIIFLAQGQKRIYIGDDTYTYDPLNYLILSVPLPLECEAAITPDKPLLGFRIDVDVQVIGEMLLHLKDMPQESKNVPKCVASAPIDSQLTDASVRLLETLSSSESESYIGSLVVKEIIYRVLTGEKGESLRALAYRNQKFFQIAHILDKIHKSYNAKLDMNHLATEAGMSISAFHSSFKAVTNSSPLQYIKNVRLHKARMLMIEDGISAYNASFSVGYESPSQFNREYKRLFGLTPGKDAQIVEHQLVGV